MSRRHKENEIDNIKPQQAESHEDGSQEREHSLLNKFLKFTVTNKRLGTSTRYLAEIFSSAFTAAFEMDEIEVDNDWVKIPRRFIKYSLFSISHELWHLSMTSYPAKEKPKRGRPWMKRFIDKFEDCKVVEWFKTTLKAAKETCKELYHGLTQFSVCFQNGIHEAFCPDDDPYGKMSHYYRMLKPEIPNFPSRETLSRNYRWFRDWCEPVTYEDGKAKRAKHKHRIWERLICWIKDFLLKLAPQYAAQPLYGVGI